MIHRAAKRRVKDYTAPNRLHVDTQQCSSKYLQNCAGWDLFSHIEHFKKKRGEKRRDDILALSRMGTAV